MAEKPEEKAGVLHQQDALASLAEQLRKEAERAEARARRLRSGEEKVSCAPGCWNILSTCIMVEPL
jgi:hypothetical protein